MEPNKTIIKVKDLTKQYGELNAVKGISFEVYQGEIFGLLGPNGAGKTTTLEIMETLRDKSGGEVTIDGFDVDKHPQEIKKIIGVQLQAAGYYPNLKLTELLTLFAGLYNRKIVGENCKGEEKVRRLKEYLKEESIDVDFKNSYMFSDSLSDLPLFNLVGNPYLINYKGKSER